MTWTPKPDHVTAKQTGGEQYKPHPEGGYPSVCVDVIDLGERVDTYMGPGSGHGKTSIQHRAALCYATGERREDGELFIVSREFTVSMGDKANLRRFLEDWRGRKYTPAQLEEGAPLHKLAGQPGFIWIEHKPSKSNPDRVYANIRQITPLPKGVEPPVIEKYERPAYWAEKKAGYAEGLAKYRAALVPAHAGAAGEDDDFPPPAEPEDDDLPF